MSEIKIPVGEALRYMRAANADPDTRQLAEDTARMLEKRVQPRYLWRACRIDRTGGEVSLPEAGLALPGDLAGKMLAECDTAVLLVATLGAAFDRILNEWEARDMAKAVVVDVCGSAWTEAVCDAAEAEIRGRFPGLYCTDRFSPGYGDLPLDLQAGFLRALDAGRKLGITANESSLLIPCKSVTAVIGLSEKPQGAKIRGCGYCSLRETCEYRKEGTEMSAACGR